MENYDFCSVIFGENLVLGGNGIITVIERIRFERKKSFELKSFYLLPAELNGEERVWKK